MLSVIMFWSNDMHIRKSVLYVCTYELGSFSWYFPCKKAVGEFDELQQTLGLNEKRLYCTSEERIKKQIWSCVLVSYYVLLFLILKNVMWREELQLPLNQQEEPQQRIQIYVLYNTCIYLSLLEASVTLLMPMGWYKYGTVHCIISLFSFPPTKKKFSMRLTFFSL